MSMMPEKVPEAQVSQPVVVVVVTSRTSSSMYYSRPVTRSCYALLLLLLFTAFQSHAEVLPEDRADVLYHRFSGGGVTISGPSILVRKKFNEKVSATVNHYVDNVSSASIDVITTASPYTENRKENSISVNFLEDKTLMSMGYTRSIENDFDASTLSLNLSQTLFGELTTFSMGYAEGDNIVGRRGDANFKENASTRSYRLSLSQIITKDLLMVLAFETMTDQGFLNNPYRSVRYLNNLVPIGYSYQPEVYPNTRTSHAIALRARYYLPYRAALSGGYRLFTDTWGINAHTFELGYTLPFRKDWLFDFSYRFYTQDKADFYSDLFQTADEFIFLARDKELSTFTSQTLGAGVSLEFKKNGTGLIKRGTLNFNYDLILFDYEDFRDLTVNATPGTEPLYSFNAGVIRLFLSIWY